MTTIETRVHELAAQVADLSDLVSELRGQLAALMQAPAPAAPVVQVSAPPARVEVQGTPVTVNMPPPADVVVEHEWAMERGHLVPVRSTVRRRT